MARVECIGVLEGKVGHSTINRVYCAAQLRRAKGMKYIFGKVVTLGLLYIVYCEVFYYHY